MEFPPLLITSSVHVSAPETKIVDSNERISLTLFYLDLWVAKFPNLKIILCDGSGFDFSGHIRNDDRYKNIESISFKNNSTKVSEFGKGYGEGEIINFALENSKLLEHSNAFAKITSKMWVKNFRQCADIWRTNFLGMPMLSVSDDFSSVQLDRIDTRFWITDTKFFKEFFSQAYLNVRDSEGYFLEHAFRDVVLNKRIKNFGFSIYPDIEGVSGSLGADFRTLIPMQLKIGEAIARAIAMETSDYIYQD
jgi:hypothetical protein